MVLKNLQGSSGETDKEQTYGPGESEGEREMYGESDMETYMTVCKIDSQREFAVWLRILMDTFSKLKRVQDILKVSEITFVPSCSLMVFFW